ncbi:hypothetical protein [Aestuariivivens sediminis]|uniref:hypothetical protein n=1 Tax=Aestuariivivens sediminis TaxID=2913557 RepID=UPI001F5A6D36|nr:hypothetical protein [Aestuariivivens sediminis]
MKHFIICFSFICLITNASYAQTKIGKAENSLENKDEQATSNDQEDWDGEGNDFFVGTFAEVIAEALLYVSYYTLIESPFEGEHRGSRASLTRHPYNKSNKGSYSYNLDENYSTFRTELSSRYISENNALKGMNLALEMRFIKRLGVELDYHQLWERNFNFGNDNLAFYNMLVKYYRVRTEKLDAWWGIGTTYVDGMVDQFGFMYGLGAELFFAKPLSLIVIFKQTFINSETVNTLNLMLNYHIRQFKVIGGYQGLKIGSQRFSMITLGTGIFF